ncbi:YceI family protein [Hyunsoonleella flava]|nr:YceI family protein [Hyunsoonleella flava]
MKTLVLLFFTFFLLPIHAQEIDTENSKVLFAVSNMKVRTVEGKIGGMKGEIILDEAKPSKSYIDVCLDAKTINTDNTKRDNHLKGEDFFDVEQFPDICFVSSVIENKADLLYVTGELSLHGISKTVSIPLEYRNKELTGTLKILRKDFKLGPNGGFMVGKEILVTIKCRFK